MTTMIDLVGTIEAWCLMLSTIARTAVGWLRRRLLLDMDRLGCKREGGMSGGKGLGLSWQALDGRTVFRRQAGTRHTISAGHHVLR